MIAKAMRSALMFSALAGAFTITAAGAGEGYVQKWKKISDLLYLDLNSIAHTTDGGVYANAYFGPAGTTNIDGFQHLLFNCQGSYRSATSFGAPVLSATPGTPMGEFATVACASPNGTAVQAATSRLAPRYCKGFNTNDCQYIQEFVDNDILPDWCEGAITRRINARETRICDAMGAKRSNY